MRSRSRCRRGSGGGERHGRRRRRPRPPPRSASPSPTGDAGGGAARRAAAARALDRSRGGARFQVGDDLGSQQIFGIDVEGWRPGEAKVFDASVLGFPLESLAQVPAGTYRAQALLHLYETFRRADGHTVKLPMDRGEGQQWSRAPGNLFSTPRELAVDPRRDEELRLALDQTIPPLPEPAATKYVRHERIQSERLTEFWGRPMHLGAHVLLPHGYDEHPEARYPLVIFHGHFPANVTGSREEPPDPDIPCEYSERFRLDCYNRIQQEQAHQLYKDWTGPGFRAPSSSRSSTPTPTTTTPTP